MSDTRRRTAYDISVILMDIHMPGMSGIEAIKQLDKYRPEGDLKVCFISGERDESVVKSALAAGGTDFFKKPIDAKLLIPKIKRLMGDSDDTDDFTKLKVDLEAQLLGFPFELTLNLHEIYELGLSLTSPLPLKESGIFDITIPYFTKLYNKDVKLSCKITKVSTKDQIHTCECRFVGADEGLLKIIRSLTIKGDPISDKELEEQAS